MQRPSTSKSRGTCKYYKDPRGCFAGNKCKFTHAEPEAQALTPYDQAKTCRFYVQGYCKRGEGCWFKHSLPKSAEPVVDEEEEPEPCSICFDTPTTYGLLVTCSHVFCIKCIKEWRDSARKNNEGNMMKVTKQCPMCRAESKYVTPSSIPFKNGDPRKESTIVAYKESMARVPCRHFERSKKDPTKAVFCPFGKDCFYQHKNEDGTPYVFADGAEVNMRIAHRHDDGRFPGRSPIELFEAFMSDHLAMGDISDTLARIDLEDGGLADLLQPFAGFRSHPPSAFFRPMNNRTAFPGAAMPLPPPRVPTPAPPHDDPEMPALELVRTHSNHSVSSSGSMPRLQDVSDSDESELNFSLSDGEDDPSNDDDSSGPDDEMPALQALDDSDDSDDDAPGRNTGGEQSLPPFVTDGRGRVIGATPEPLQDDSEEGAAGRRGLLNRMFGALF